MRSRPRTDERATATHRREQLLPDGSLHAQVRWSEICHLAIFCRSPSMRSTPLVCLLHLVQSLLDGTRDEHLLNEHRLGLANAIHAVERLSLDARIPD